MEGSQADIIKQQKERMKVASPPSSQLFLKGIYLFFVPTHKWCLCVWYSKKEERERERRDSECLTYCPALCENAIKRVTLSPTFFFSLKKRIFHLFESLGPFHSPFILAFNSWTSLFLFNKVLLTVYFWRHCFERSFYFTIVTCIYVRMLKKILFLSNVHMRKSYISS